MAQLWPDERIHEVVYHQGTYKDGWEFSDVERLLSHVRDDYQHHLDVVVDYAIVVDAKLDALKGYRPHIVQPTMTLEEAAAAVRAEFGNFSFLNDATPK